MHQKYNTREARVIFESTESQTILLNEKSSCEKSFSRAKFNKLKSL